MGSWNDFNDAQSNTNLIPKGTLAKVRLTIRPGGFDDASQGWTGGHATRGSTGAVYLNGEFTVTEPGQVSARGAGGVDICDRRDREILGRRRHLRHGAHTGSGIEPGRHAAP